MASKAITIYTPEGTPAHIGAQDDAFIYDAIMQGRSGIFGALTCEKVNSNTVVLSGGGAVNRGYIMYVPAGEVHELEIYNCDGAMLRRDIIASVFTKGDGDTADRHEFRVIMGNEDAELPLYPELVTCELETAGDVNEVELFGVMVNGEGIVSIDALSDNTAVPQEAQTAQKAKQLSEIRRFDLNGDISGIGVFDGSNDMTAAVSVLKVKGYEVFIQQSEPISPKPGDIWLW